MIESNSSAIVTVEQLVYYLSNAYAAVIENELPFKSLPSVMLWGPPGVGKSQGVRQIASKVQQRTGKQVNITDVRLLLFNPVDLRGIPTANADRTLAIWLKPQIFQMDDSTDVVNILLLDEISAAPPSVQAAAYQITLDRVIGEHKLPDNCFVIAAGNRTTDKSVAYTMPKALANRMCHLEVISDHDSWHKWAIKSGIHESVIGYLNYKPEKLMQIDAKDANAFATPRTWEMVSRLLTCVSTELAEIYPMVVGCIGEELANDFREWYDVFQNVPPVDKIFAGTHNGVPQIPGIIYFVDDGYSGANFNRPDWQRMIELVENDKVGIILAKDMSRIGRNYLEIGIYTEMLFPEHNVRFIAVNSGVDSANQQDNDFTPFLNIINEFYVKDSSKKVKASMKQKGESGEYLTTNPPYGYMKDPDNPKKHWIVDDEAAAVVRQIFAWCMEGYGPSQIAHKLKEAKVDSPTGHWMKLGRNAPSKTPDDPYGWVPDTVSGILEKQEYLGHTVNFKTRRVSYKSKKKLENPPEQWKIFENTHEAIIDEDTFARVQELRKNKRRPSRTGKANVFSGLARCADCGEKLYYCTSKSFETRQDHFICSASRKRGKDVCETHFIRAVMLEEGTLQHLRLVQLCIADYEDAFRKALGAKRSAEVKKELAAKRRTLQKSENRLAELDKLFKRIYEDMVNGKLSEARFQMLSDDYEREQADLRIKIEMLENEIQNQEDQAENVDRFIRQAKKYLYLEKLTPTVLNDMVQAVYVHAPDTSSGQRIQDVDISYNYIGILPANLLYDIINGEAA